MLDAASLPQSVSEILVTRLDALGDIVLGTMLLSGLHERWPQAAIRLIVRPQLAGAHAILPQWVHVTALPFDPRQDIAGRDPEVIDLLREFASRHRPQLAVIAEYNRTWAGELLVGLCGASHVFTFDGPTGLNFRHQAMMSALKVDSQEKWNSVAVESEERESAKYIKLLNALGIDGSAFEPGIVIREEDRHEARALWANTGESPEKSIVCFPSSGEGLIRSLDAPAWSRWIARLRLTRPVMLLGTEADVPVLDAIEACGNSHETSRIIVPLDKVGVTAAFIECCGAYIGMDTGPMHLSAVLGRPTLGVFGGGHRAERFLPVGRRAAAVYMPLGCYGCDWFCPFDSRLCIKEIPEWPLSEIGDAFLNDFPHNANPFNPKVFEITAPPDLPTVLLGPMMRNIGGSSSTTTNSSSTTITLPKSIPGSRKRSMSCMQRSLRLPSKTTRKAKP